MPNPLEELQEAYREYLSLEKSRKNKMDKGHLEHEETLDEEDFENAPRDEADEQAEEDAAERQKELFHKTSKSRRRKHHEEENESEHDGEDGDGEEEELMKCHHCGAHVEKGHKFCHNCGGSLKKSKAKDAATKAIRDSEDAYFDDEDDEDIHGEPEDIGEEQGRGDDETIITNMGRRVRPGVKKSLREEFYGDLIKSTGFDEAFFDANPAVEQMADVMGDYLDTAERRISALEKSLKKTQKMLEKSLSAQAAILRANTMMQRQIDALASQPADEPATGYLNWQEQVEHMAKSQAQKNAGKQKLSKSLVREKLTKAMAAEIIEPHLLADFDNYMAKGLSADEWVENTLTEDQRQALGL